MSKSIKVKLLFPLISLIIVVLCLPNIVLCQHNSNQITSTHGDLKITGVLVNRINLALKEIDVEIGILDVSVNGPFNLTIWAPFRQGGPLYHANGTPGSPPWYEWNRSQWKWLMDVSIKTLGFRELNYFPFEKYETEIIFGLSCPNVTVTILDAYLSWELEQQGTWTIEAFPVNTPHSKIASLNATYGDRIEEYGVKTFVSLIIRFGHPEGYIWKMLIPTWGPTFFTTGIMIVQFLFLRKKMRRSDHISVFVAIAIFTLGTSLAIREMTPPELTFSELSSFFLAVAYSVALFVTICRSSHKMDEEKTEKKLVVLETKIDKMEKAVEKLDLTFQDTLEALKKEEALEKRKKTTRRKPSGKSQS